MKKRILSIILCLCMVLSCMTVLGAVSVGGGSAKPFIPYYDYLEDGETYYGFFDQDSFWDNGDYLEASFYVPTQDGGMHGFGGSVGSFTKVNGRTYNSLSQLEAAIPHNIPVAVTVDELQISDNGYTTGIYEINFDATPVTYTAKTYSASTGTLAGLSKDLPIFYCMVDNWDGEIWYNWFYPYLDENHYYDLNVYDYGIVITNMYAKNNQTTLYNIGTTTTPNGKMLSNIQVTAWEDYTISGIKGEIYDANGNKLQAVDGKEVEWEWVTTFTDLPAAAGTYTIKLWGLRNGSVATPIYSYEYEKEEVELESGTVTKIQDDSNSYYSAARVYLQLDGKSGERGYYCHFPVEVGNTVCTNTGQLLSAMPVGSYVTVAVAGFGCAFRIGEATTAYDNYGVISRFQIAYNTVEEYVRVELGLPDGTYETYAIYPGAKMGDEKMNDVDDIYDYIKRNNGVPASFNQENGEITHFTVGEEGKYEEKYNQTYSVVSKAFTNLSAKQQKLPVYYSYNGGFYPAYLDENHNYDLAIFDHGIVITDISARYMNETVKTIQVNANGDANLKQEIGFVCNVSGGATLAGRLYDANGREIQFTTGIISGDEGEIVFTDLPNVSASYRYLLWVENGGGSIISPYYESKFDVKALPSGSGTITEARVMPGSWDTEEALAVKIRKDGTGEIVETATAARFFVDGELYTNTEEMAALLPVGTKIEYIGDVDGNLVAVKRSVQEKLSYGTVISYSSTGIEIRTADGVDKRFNLANNVWLNGHFMNRVNTLDSVLNNASSWHVAYVASGDEITSLKTSSLPVTQYTDATYNVSGKYFNGLHTKEKLPIIYMIGTSMATPVLDSNHRYNLNVYEYGVEITGIKGKDKDGAITHIDAGTSLNNSFLKDVEIEIYPTGIQGGNVLKVQLLDSRGYLQQEYSYPIEGNDLQDVTIPNLPNQDSEYRIKMWIENAQGERISNTYVHTVKVEETDISYGTITDATTGTDENGEACVILKVSIPGLDEPVTVTCPLGTVINGVEITSEADLLELLETGTLVKIADDGKRPNIQFADSVQNVTDVNVNGNSVSANINMSVKPGTTIAGTAYVGVYSKEGIIKKLTATPFTVVAGQPNDPVPVNVEGITYAQGDYLKVVCMDENSRPLCNVMKVDI